MSSDLIPNGPDNTWHCHATGESIPYWLFIRLVSLLNRHGTRYRVWQSLRNDIRTTFGIEVTDTVIHGIVSMLMTLSLDDRQRLDLIEERDTQPPEPGRAGTSRFLDSLPSTRGETPQPGSLNRSFHAGHRPNTGGSAPNPPHGAQVIEISSSEPDTLPPVTQGQTRGPGKTENLQDDSHNESNPGASNLPNTTTRKRSLSSSDGGESRPHKRPRTTNVGAAQTIENVPARGIQVRPRPTAPSVPIIVVLSSDEGESRSLPLSQITESNSALGGGTGISPPRQPRAGPLDQVQEGEDHQRRSSGQQADRGLEEMRGRQGEQLSSSLQLLDQESNAGSAGRAPSFSPISQWSNPGSAGRAPSFSPPSGRSNLAQPHQSVEQPILPSDSPAGERRLPITYPSFSPEPQVDGEYSRFPPAFRIYDSAHEAVQRRRQQSWLLERSNIRRRVSQIGPMPEDYLMPHERPAGHPGYFGNEEHAKEKEDENENEGTSNAQTQSNPSRRSGTSGTSGVARGTGPARMATSQHRAQANQSRDERQKRRRQERGLSE